MSTNLSSTQTEIVKAIADKADLNPRKVKEVFSALEEIITQELECLGMCKIAGLFNIKVIEKPAVKGGEKKVSFGKEYVTKARPAKKVIKVYALKKLKSCVP